jgi:hypothetical protein
VKSPEREPVKAVLDGVSVDGITSSLRPGVDSDVGSVLSANAAKQFYGVVPTGNGFILGDEEALELLARGDADYSEVIRPYLIGDDITKSPKLCPTRWIINFAEMPLEVAARWPAALEVVRERVKPLRDQHKKRRERDEWWKFSRTVQDLFAAIAGKRRFIACPAQAKRFFMVWCEPHWCPSNLTAVFAFEDDYAVGVLSSRLHTVWATTQSTKLETRPRYTTSSFMTFPWPQPSDREPVAEVARAMIARRSEICLERQIGLTRLYNEVDDGAYRDLRDLHVTLDEAVAAAYGWPAAAAHDSADSNRRLLELNRAIAAGEVAYHPFD